MELLSQAKHLIREVKEETGANVEITNIVGIYSNTKKKKEYNGVEEVPTFVTIDFICKYISAFSCLGYKVNSSNEIEIHEEYLFDR